MAMTSLEKVLSKRRASTGRPAEDLATLATALMAILNLPTTRNLIFRLRVDEALRQFLWLVQRARSTE